MRAVRSRSVYIVGVDDCPVKIGIADNLAKRISQLQVGCPDELRVHHVVRVPYYVGQNVEAMVHARFADRHRRGEWFDVTAAEAYKAVLEVANETTATIGYLARQRGEWLAGLSANYPIDPEAGSAIRQYRDRLNTPYGKRQVAATDAYIARSCGTAAYTLFKKVVAEHQSLDRMFFDLGLNSDAKTKAEGLLAKAVNALADFRAASRQDELLRRIA